MKAREFIPDHKISDDDRSEDQGYAEWKRAKIERSLAQSADRDSMIPAEQVWRELGLER